VARVWKAYPECSLNIVAEEVSRSRQETEAKRQDREWAEHRIAKLGEEVDDLVDLAFMLIGDREEFELKDQTDGSLQKLSHPIIFFSEWPMCPGVLYTKSIAYFLLVFG